MMLVALLCQYNLLVPLFLLKLSSKVKVETKIRSSPFLLLLKGALRSNEQTRVMIACFYGRYESDLGSTTWGICSSASAWLISAWSGSWSNSGNIGLCPPPQVIRTSPRDSLTSDNGDSREVHPQNFLRWTSPGGSLLLLYPYSASPPLMVFLESTCCG